MNKNRYRLGIGPMSKQIISSVYSYSHEKSTALMLIPSKNQVDYESGYVLSTQEFSNYCKGLKKEYPNSDVLLCRDHCGPGFNGNLAVDDVYRTIDSDLDNDFDLIHIDFSNLKDSKEILVESKRAVEYILQKNSKMALEIGTESIDNGDFRNLNKVKSEMEFFSSFCSPTFFVCQTGTLIKEMEQAGKFDNLYVKEQVQLARRNSLTIKEHNADYLSVEEIQQRKGLVDAMNIAPQLGVLQTLFTLEKARLYGIKTDEFLEESYRSKKWEKWLYKHNSSDLLRCSIIAGHYNFNTKAYEDIVAAISKQEDFSQSLEQELHKLFDHYLATS